MADRDQSYNSLIPLADDLAEHRYGDTISVITPTIRATPDRGGVGRTASEHGQVKRLQAETAVELDALLPSILDKAFRGEL